MSIQLNKGNTMAIQLGPKWLELLPGFRVQVKTISERMRVNAADAYLKAKIAAQDEGLPDDDAVRAGDDAFARSLAVDGIIDWAGDITAPDGEPAMVTAANINMLLDYAPAYMALNERYIDPLIMDIAIKNGYSPSSTGSTDPAGAKNTAAAASNPPDSDGAGPPAPS